MRKCVPPRPAPDPVRDSVSGAPRDVGTTHPLSSPGNAGTREREGPPTGVLARRARSRRVRLPNGVCTSGRMLYLSPPSNGIWQSTFAGVVEELRRRAVGLNVTTRTTGESSSRTGWPKPTTRRHIGNGVKVGTTWVFRTSGNNLDLTSRNSLWLGSFLNHTGGLDVNETDVWGFR